MADEDNGLILRNVGIQRTEKAVGRHTHEESNPHEGEWGYADLSAPGGAVGPVRTIWVSGRTLGQEVAQYDRRGDGGVKYIESAGVTAQIGGGYTAGQIGEGGTTEQIGLKHNPSRVRPEEKEDGAASESQVDRPSVFANTHVEQLLSQILVTVQEMNADVMATTNDFGDSQQQERFMRNINLELSSPFYHIYQYIDSAIEQQRHGALHWKFLLMSVGAKDQYRPPVSRDTDLYIRCLCMAGQHVLTVIKAHASVVEGYHKDIGHPKAINSFGNDRQARVNFTQRISELLKILDKITDISYSKQLDRHVYGDAYVQFVNLQADIEKTIERLDQIEPGLGSKAVDLNKIELRQAQIMQDLQGLSERNNLPRPSGDRNHQRQYLYAFYRKMGVLESLLMEYLEAHCGISLS